MSHQNIARSNNLEEFCQEQHLIDGRSQRGTHKQTIHLNDFFGNSEMIIAMARHFVAKITAMYIDNPGFWSAAYHRCNHDLDMVLLKFSKCNEAAKNCVQTLNSILIDSQQDVKDWVSNHAYLSEELLTRLVDMDKLHNAKSVQQTRIKVYKMACSLSVTRDLENLVVELERLAAIEARLNELKRAKSLRMYIAKLQRRMAILDPGRFSLKYMDARLKIENPASISAMKSY